MKNVFVSGAAGNLGRATVLKFIEGGFKVWATIEPGTKLTYQHAAISVLEVDHKNEEATTLAINKIFANATIDAAVLLVGGFAMGSIEDTNGELLKNMFTLNFDTAYFAARPLFRNMMNQSGSGRIVFVGARPALVPTAGKGALAYALSKSLLFRLAEYLNAEAAGKKVVSHVIVPSIMDTPANRAAMPTADFSAWVKPEAVAEALFFLCTENGNAVRDTVLKLYGDS